MKPFETVISLLLLLAALASVAHGGVYLSKEEALDRAFPGAGRVETVNLYLSAEEVERIARETGARPDSAIATFYIGRNGDAVTGYAAIEADTVRTVSETVLVALDPAGTVRFVEILAFFEPEEYKPNGRWLNQFAGKTLSPRLRIGDRIQGITGATLSAQAITRQVRKSAALCRLLLERQ